MISINHEPLSTSHIVIVEVYFFSTTNKQHNAQMIPYPVNKWTRV